MDKFVKIAIIILLGLSSCGKCKDRGYARRDMASLQERSDSLENDITLKALATADSILAGMTVEEMIGQCFMPALFSSSDSHTLDRLRSYILDLHMGGIVLLRGDLRSAAQMAELSKISPVPLFISIDAEWGLGMRFTDAPDFPKNGYIRKDVSEDLMYDYGREVARECKRTGINMVLGPVVDVVDNNWSLIGSRSFGNDPVRVANLGTSYAKGMESGGVVSVAKHFPGHGSPSGDSHRTLPVISKSLHGLDSIDLYPFKRYVDSGLSGVMIGHLAVPAIDPEGRPAAVSPPVIKELLREELGFNGLVLTDAFTMGGVAGYRGADALKAGADIVVAPYDTYGEIREIVDIVKKGEIPLAELKDKCRRILFYKALFYLDNNDKINLEGLEEAVKGESDTLNFKLRYKD